MKLIKESFLQEQSQIIDDNGELIKENINPKLIKAVEEHKAKIDVINEEHYVPFLTTLEQELNKNIADGDVKFSVANTEFNVKSVGSILSKLYRKNIINNDDYTISQSKDLLRSYITFRGEQYNKVDIEVIFNTLDRLITETFEKNGEQVKFSVEGMSVSKSGYRAIHLTFMINGVMTEMQLHTDASWQIKMEQEPIYAKWRNYDIEKLSPEKKVAYENDLITSKNDGADLNDIYGDLEEFIMKKASFSVRSLQSSANENTLALVFTQEDPFQMSIESLSADTLNTEPVSLSRIYVYDIKSPLSNDSLHQNNNDVNNKNRYSLKRGDNLIRDKNFRNFSNDNSKIKRLL